MQAIYGLVPLIVLTPLIPAYILFKTLKTTAEVSGKEFMGFQVQLGGAFAGYFVVLLLLVHTFSDSIHPPKTQTVYHLKGQVVDDQNQGVALTEDSFALIPAQRPMVSTSKNGEFDLSFIIDPDDASYPSVEVSYGDFLPTDLVLDPTDVSAPHTPPLKIKRNDAEHIIYVESIPLRRAAQGEVHVSAAQPVSGVAAEYQNITPAHPQARPPGYGAGTDDSVATRSKP